MWYYRVMFALLKIAVCNLADMADFIEFSLHQQSSGHTWHSRHQKVALLLYLCTTYAAFSHTHRWWRCRVSFCTLWNTIYIREAFAFPKSFLSEASNDDITDKKVFFRSLGTMLIFLFWNQRRRGLNLKWKIGALSTIQVQSKMQAP
jgi:hypothetical protein